MSIRVFVTSIIFSNTKNDGPVVLDVPPAAAGSQFLGTIMDFWQVPLIDVGVGGKGGKYLILPPDYKDDVPAGYIPLRSKRYNNYTLIRSIVASRSEADVRAGDALVKQIKVYPLSKAGNPPEPRFIDMTDNLYNAIVPYDDSFYVSLARVINEEPVQSRDLQMLGMLLPLDIEKGKEFKPDPATRAQLKAAAAEAHAWLIDGIISTFARYWPDGKWNIPISAIALKTEFLWEVPNYFDVDARGITLASFFGPVATLGAGSFYLSTFFDKNGGRLSGANTYRLHVPRECSCERVLGPDRVRPGDGGVLPQFDAPYGRLFGQRAAKECRWVRGHLRWPESARRHGGELDLHPAGKELVSVVSLLWSGKGNLRQELAIARH